MEKQNGIITKETNAPNQKVTRHVSEVSRYEMGLKMQERDIILPYSPRKNLLQASYHGTQLREAGCNGYDWSLGK